MKKNTKDSLYKLLKIRIKDPGEKTNSVEEIDLIQ